MNSIEKKFGRGAEHPSSLEIFTRSSELLPSSFRLFDDEIDFEYGIEITEVDIIIKKCSSRTQSFERITIPRSIFDKFMSFINLKGTE